MGFIIKDRNPQFEVEAYYVGDRKVRDPQGRDCMAADFGEKKNARQFANVEDANNFATQLNHMARREQFVVEEVNVYSMSYTRGRKSDTNSPHNGFEGYGGLPPRRQ